MVPKKILLLGFVDLVDHIASSILARLVALSELSAPSVEIILSFHAYRSLHASCRQCFVENDCMRPCLVKIASLSLERASNCTKILYCEAFPSILVWRDPWLGKIAWSFLHAIYVFHRVHCSEEDRLSSSLEAFSSWN